MSNLRVKPVPPVPDDLDRVSEIRAAVPLVPGTVDDCCARLMNRAAVPAQDDARTWLTFLRGLGLVREADRGFARTREPSNPDREWIAAAFESGVYGARELLGILEDADGLVDADTAFERFREHVPTWEKHRSDTWEQEYRERVRRLLGWAALLGLVDSTAEGYGPAEDGT